MDCCYQKTWYSQLNMNVVMLSLFGVSVLFETILIFFSHSKGLRVVLASISIMTGGFAATSWLVIQPSIATMLLFILSVVRFINPLRYVEERMQAKELRSRALRTYIFMLTLILALICYVALIDKNYSLSIYVIVWTQLIFAILLGVSVLLARTIYRYRSNKQIPSKLPTVSVCLPARNETADLPQCVESILASNYPKLEIIVLDDCSHDKTPDIIKKYAHDGVRFVNGKEPRDDWLAKNAAYDRLADEARGEILVFIGVDVRFEPQTISELVGQIADDEMISVLPRRKSESESAFFIQPLRYWWELGLWRFRIKSPPVLSSCWAIRAETLKKLGTFESVKKAIEPEAAFARALAKQKKYAFLVSNDNVGVSSVKTPKDQYLTALRKRYGQVRRRPESAVFVVILEVVFILGPWIIGLYALLNSMNTVFQVSAMSALIVSLSNAEVYKLALRRLWPLGLISVPALVIADALLMIRSLYAYEFGKVVWKERNICLPLLTVEKSLPKV